MNMRIVVKFYSVTFYITVSQQFQIENGGYGNLLPCISYNDAVFRILSFYPYLTEQ